MDEMYGACATHGIGENNNFQFQFQWHNFTFDFPVDKEFWCVLIMYWMLYEILIFVAFIFHFKILEKFNVWKLHVVIQFLISGRINRIRIFNWFNLNIHNNSLYFGKPLLLNLKWPVTYIHCEKPPFFSSSYNDSRANSNTGQLYLYHFVLLHSNHSNM